MVPETHSDNHNNEKNNNSDRANSLFGKNNASLDDHESFSCEGCMATEVGIPLLINAIKDMDDKDVDVGGGKKDLPHVQESKKKSR